MTTLQANHSRLLKAHSQTEINEAINFVSARIDAFADAEHRYQMLRDRSRRASLESSSYWAFLTDTEQRSSGITDAKGGPNSEAAIYLAAKAELADDELAKFRDQVYRSKQDLQAQGATIALAEFACRAASHGTSLFL